MRRESWKSKNWGLTSSLASSWSSIEGLWFQSTRRKGDPMQRRNRKDSRIFTVLLRGWMCRVVRRRPWSGSWRVWVMSRGCCKARSMTWRGRLKVKEPRSVLLSGNSMNLTSPLTKRSSSEVKKRPKSSGSVMKSWRKTLKFQLLIASINKCLRRGLTTWSQDRHPGQPTPTQPTSTNLSQKSLT